MIASSALERGRKAFGDRVWGAAFSQLSAADRETPLGPEDLVCLATAAHLLGRDVVSDDVLARAHHAFVERGDVEGASRCAFWLAHGMFSRGDQARASGWLARAQRLLDNDDRDCAEQGYLLLARARAAAASGDGTAAYALFREAAGVGDRFGDSDLVTLARHGEGRALIRMGQKSRGVALLDEVMVGVATGETSAIVVGIVYCSVISACREIFDLRRAREWTAALSEWCAAQEDLVPYRGECLVRRAEIMQLEGQWDAAMEEARRATEWCTRPGDRVTLGEAFYQLAELHRLRGEFPEAEAAYRHASVAGRKPDPGLALLRLAQGQVDVAEAAIRRIVNEASDRRSRSRVLAPCVWIALAIGDLAEARTRADELAALAAELDAPFLHALAAQTTGAILLAEDEPRAALSSLRRAAALWRDMDAPHEIASVGVLLAQACSALGDHDSAQIELDAARATFTRLGATPDLARIDALSPRAVVPRPGGLTTRELQVLRLVAAGKTNRIIARDLGISEKTVARHVSNIFLKLDVSSRAAATAYAYEHDLI